MTLLRAALMAAVSMVAACSPTLNWRDVQPPGSGVRLTFPCKPSSRAREVVLAGRPATMQLHSCDAGDATFALMVAEFADSSPAAAGVDVLEAAAGSNIGASAPSRQAFVAKGIASSVAAEKLIFTGKLPDGSPVRLEATFFKSGPRIYQATILSKQDKRLPADAADTFFDGLTLMR